MKIDYISTSISGTTATVSYQINPSDDYSSDAYRHNITLSFADTFQAMQKATTEDPLYGFRLLVLQDFIAQRESDVKEAKTLANQYGGTYTVTESTATSESQSQA